MHALISQTDWWILVVIPLFVGIMGVYTQRIIDSISRLTWERVRKRRARAVLRNAQETIYTILDGTFDTNYNRYNTYLIVSCSAAVLISGNVTLFAYHNDMTKTVNQIWLLIMLINLLSTTWFVGSTFHRAHSMFKDSRDIQNLLERTEKRISKLAPGVFESDIEQLRIFVKGVQSLRNKRIRDVSLLITLESQEEQKAKL